MKQHDHNTPFQDEQMPESWTPENDQERDWEVLTALLKQADSPELPPPSLFEATQMEIRRQLKQEGLLKPGPVESPGNDLGFVDWLKVVFTGGKSGAQMLRLGLVAAVFSYAGVQLSTQQLQEFPSPGTNFTVSEPAAEPKIPSVDSNNVIVAERPTGAPTIATRVDKNPENFGGNSPDWGHTASPSQKWVNSTSGARPVAVGTRPANTGSRSDAALVSQALDQLQYLKFYSTINKEDQYLSQLRQLEGLLTEMASENGQVMLDAQTTAMQQYRIAEHAQRAQRYPEAEKLYLDVVRRAPGSPLAFLAEFQAGRIALDHLQDYDLARRSYVSCLEDYPSVSIPEDHQRYLEEWVGILNAGLADQWESLEQWQKAKAATSSQQAAIYLVAVVKTSPSEQLVSMAADELKDLMIADAFDRRLNHQDVCDILKNRIDQMRDETEKAETQFSLAEILAKRSQNPAKAAIAYQKVLKLEAGEKLHRIARSRLQLMMNQRLTGVTGPEK